MLAAVGVVAVFFGWFAAARHRANAQDAIIAALENDQAGSSVWIERCGPEWLDIVGAERYRRYIRAVEFRGHGDAREEDVVFKHLRQLPNVRYFFCEIRQLTPSMANSLRDMHGLRVLSIDTADLSICDENEPIWRDCFVAVAKMSYLEQLRLDLGQSTIDSGNLVHLAGLANLRRLSLNSVRTDDESLLAQLPALPKLETVDLRNSAVGDEDLPFLARLPKLKSLNLADTAVTHLGLADLASLQSLEELTISSDAVTPAGLDSLRALKRLNKLHVEGISWRRELGDRAKLTPLALDGRSAVGVAERDFDADRNALEALRRAKPGIVIDRDELHTRWTAGDMVPSGYDACDGLDFDLELHQLIREWHELQSAH